VSSTILRSTPTPSKSAMRPHDPGLCSLGGVSECDACRAARIQADRDFHERDADARERARRREIAERFTKATGIPLTDLAATLLPLLAEPMAEIAGAVLDERQVEQ
jgi:hypothetical protein